MKIACLQLNATVGDFRGNLCRLSAAYKRAVEKGAELVLAPELFLVGYPPRDLLSQRGFLQASDAASAEVARFVGDVPLIVGVVSRNSSGQGKALYNSAAVYQSGQTTHLTHKSLLPTYDVFDEHRYFEPAVENRIWSWAGKRIGITVCEDIWNDADFWPEQLYRHDPIKELMQQGCEVILNLSASPWQVGKERLRHDMLAKVASSEKIPVIQVNAVGGNDELVFDGQSMAFNSQGQLIAVGRSFEEDSLLVDTETLLIETIHWPSEPAHTFAALSLGLKDYVEKCGFKQVVLGLSGGIDSALTAVIAVDALGPENVLGILMPSRFSSAGSLCDAEQLALTLEIEYKTLPIEAPYQSIVSHLDSFLSGTKPDQTEENLQSRIRGLTLMAISNKTGRLVLTTGNKSELAVGYCTLYGDMCGALAVISDLSKTKVYEMSRWVNRRIKIIPENSITKAPSAELRDNQTDQDSLPPYEVLDAILEAYVVRGQSVEEIVAQGFTESLVRDILRKVDINEYKRRQAAPGIKISSKAFGFGRRMPIAQNFKV
ncbi:MAG: NAD+ synthase [Blastochloris sp.]|nr:NAD+ synthase [Blastochloris sp.]